MMLTFLNFNYSAKLIKNSDFGELPHNLSNVDNSHFCERNFGSGQSLKGELIKKRFFGTFSKGFGPKLPQDSDQMIFEDGNSED